MVVEGITSPQPSATPLLGAAALFVSCLMQRPVRDTNLADCELLGSFLEISRIDAEKSYS